MRAVTDTKKMITVKLTMPKMRSRKVSDTEKMQTRLYSSETFEQQINLINF